MKTVLISLMTMLGVAVGNAGVTATDLLGDIFSEVGASYSNLSTSNGLATRDESFGYSATAAIPVEGSTPSSTTLALPMRSTICCFPTTDAPFTLAMRPPTGRAALAAGLRGSTWAMTPAAIDGWDYGRCHIAEGHTNPTR